jgi:hypothetical protein
LGTLKKSQYFGLPSKNWGLGGVWAVSPCRATLTKAGGIKSVHLDRTQEHQNLWVLKIAHCNTTNPKYYEAWSMK